MSGDDPVGGVDPRDPAVRARNRRAGLLVAGGVLLVLALAFIRFVVLGLPEDRETRERLDQQRSAAEALQQRDEGTEE